MTLTCFASAETVKHERVYAVTNAAGDALTVIDNVRLENGDALTEIDDRTLLTALENVGGTEKFTQSGETVTWKADGNSIIYQGTSDKALNVTPVVRMTLDGKEVTAADLKNASGELAMTVSYRAESPFLAVTVMPLSDDVTSVTVDNGAVLTDGAHSFLMGFGIPGADADLELPDSFTMTAHVDHADLNWMMVRRCGLLGLSLREHHEKRRDDRKSRRCRRDTAQHGARDGDEHFSPLPLSMLRGRPGNHDGFSRRNPFKRAMDSSAAYVVQ